MSCYSMGSSDDESLSGSRSSDESEFTRELPPPKRPRRNYTLVGVFSSITEALAGMGGGSGNMYSVLYNYGKKGNGQRVFGCKTHRECEKRFRVGFSDDGEGKTVTLEESGEHTTEVLPTAKTGINPLLKRESDHLLRGGAGGQKARKLLGERYAKNVILDAILPTEKQLTNRKAYLKRKAADGWEIRNMGELLEWIADKKCVSKDNFFGAGGQFDAETDESSFSTQPAEFRHELIVLRSFEHAVDAQDENGAKSFGVVVSSRTCFRNILYAHQGQSTDGVLGATDGTYRLHFGKRMVASRLRDVYNPLHPTKYRLHRINCKRILSSLARHRNLELLPPLVSKGPGKSNKLLQEPTFFQSNIWPDIQYMHAARTKEQFEAFAKLFLQYWRDQGEIAYSTWFKNTYLAGVWANWFGVCAIPGVTPSQNAIEAHHRVIKQSCVTSLRASTATVLNESLPRILYHQSTTPARTKLAHYCEGPVLAEVIARKLLSTSENYYINRVTRRKIVKAIVFNASKYVVGNNNVHGNIVTRDRVKRQVELEYLSLHQVKVLCTDQLALEMESTFDHAQIDAIREKYMCDCLAFWHTGWLCSHIISAGVLLKDINFDVLIARLPVRKVAGGQRKDRGALEMSRSSSDFFSVDNLVDLFLRFPARPLHWNCLRDFTSDDGTNTEMRAGVITTWAERDGVFVWSVRFSNGENVKVECEDLAQCVNRAFAMGLEVTKTIDL
ncbi:hypothetical protein P3T76_016300 [Phytophthora citrophthora]|uniref:SWIM-type domain-containing protein n=1 Tax=Phytophthora citrophthora TaxID=4793 RepID=A0AAD9FXT4_9STRA|nr:hypothetical protein P3T76_016300 [Phytophthora citrophthora]